MSSSSSSGTSPVYLSFHTESCGVVRSADSWYRTPASFATTVAYPKSDAAEQAWCSLPPSRMLRAMSVNTNDRPTTMARLGSKSAGSSRGRGTVMPDATAPPTGAAADAWRDATAATGSLVATEAGGTGEPAMATRADAAG